MKRYSDEELLKLKRIREIQKSRQEELEKASKALNEYIKPYKLKDGSITDECRNSTEYRSLLNKFNNIHDIVYRTNRFIGAKIIKRIHIAEKNGWI